MANLVTTDDLKTYALWLSGEPTDGSSDYDERVLQHMQTVYNTFVNGGTLGTRDVASAAGLYEPMVHIPTTDWLWFRKVPPFAFNTVPAILGATSSAFVGGPPPIVIGTASVTNGSTALVFSIAPPSDVTGWRFKMLTQAQGIANPPITVPRIATAAAGNVNAAFDIPWTQETQVASDYVLFQTEYTLPTDFVRFVESPAVQGGIGFGGGGGWNSGNLPRMAIGSYEQVFDQYPLQQFNQGAPTAAARLNPSIIMINRWDTLGYRVEFSYLFTPPVLAVGLMPAQQPLIPLRFRQVLSIGAAMLVMQDKVDSRTTALASEFREIVHHMGIEYRKEQNAGSELSGRHLTRLNQRRRSMLRTTSGLPLF